MSPNINEEEILMLNHKEKSSRGNKNRANAPQLWNNIEWFNSQIIAVPEELKGGNIAEKILEEKMA